MFIREAEDGYYLTFPQQGTAREKLLHVLCNFDKFEKMDDKSKSFNQYCVDIITKLICENLNYISQNQ